jgi:hypothetical protein
MSLCGRPSEIWIRRGWHAEKLGNNRRALCRTCHVMRARVAFWNSVYDMIDREFPDYFALDRRRVPKTTFIAANCRDSPKYFRLDLKGHMGEVDLALANSGRASSLLAFLEKSRPDGSVVAFNKGSIVLRIAGLDKFEVADGFDSERVLKAFKAAKKLLEFWKSNRAFFDQLYLSTEAR